MFKRSLSISVLALCASLSFTPAHAVPSTAAVSGLASCTSSCVDLAQSMVAEIDAMPASPAKQKLLLSLVKAIGALGIANPEMAVALGAVAAQAAAGISDDAAAKPFVDQIVAALQANTPGEATAAVDDASFNDDPAS